MARLTQLNKTFSKFKNLRKFVGFSKALKINQSPVKTIGLLLDILSIPLWRIKKFQGFKNLRNPIGF